MQNSKNKHQVVIIGGGFGGLYAARAFGKKDVQVTLIDRRNFHLFQPLLYQVATGGLSPGDIASPLRAVLNRYKNIDVVMAQVEDIDADRQLVLAGEQEFYYDTLLVAAGARHHYFGNDQWEEKAPGIKTIEDALEMRQRIFQAFEAAEQSEDPEERAALMSFVVVGGGPTGVELAGAMGELASFTLKDDFQSIHTNEARIVLVEAGGQILNGYPEKLATKAMKSLEKLGVDVRLNTPVLDIQEDYVTVKSANSEEIIPCHTVLWGAGVKPSALATVLADRFHAELDRGGRVMIESNLAIKGHDSVFVIGDMANFSHQGDSPLPGVAQVAMQQGEYVAKLVLKRQEDRPLPKPFRYFDKGSMAVIGRNAAVAQLGSMGFSGFSAWLIWVFIHIAYLIGFDSKVLVLFQWASNYFTRKRGARLITGTEYAAFRESG
ncbi:MAG: NAD(P)/FAD-dependent oxidoreductase [Calditrichia bacterium]